MTPEESTELRARLGWERTRLARRPAISPSRLADFERCHGRSRNARSAPIPELIALACRWLEAHEAEQRVRTPGRTRGVMAR